MKEIELELRAFGPLKDFIPDSLTLRVAQGLRASELPGELVQALEQGSDLDASGRQKLARILAETAIAHSDRILSDADLIEDSCQLALLPPVCGG